MRYILIILLLIPNISYASNLASPPVNTERASMDTDYLSKIYDSIIKFAYGNLYEDSVGTVITVTTAGTYYKWVSGDAGDSRGVTLSAGGSTNNMTIKSGYAGEYGVSFACSYEASATDTVHWGIFKNGVKLEQASSQTKISNANSQLNVDGLGLVSLSAGDVIDLRVTSSTNGTTITVNHVSLAIWKIGI